MSNSYESKDIVALGDLQAIRDRPGMYIGETTDPGHLFNEALDNALDEVQAGYSDKAIVNIDTQKNLYSVLDYGRGIPIGKSEFTDILGNVHQIEALQLLYTKSHSGGKFGGDAYKISRGLHGVGLKCINALSTHTRAVTRRDGKQVELIMSKGDILSLNYSDTTEPNGVYVEFTPDGSIFDTDIIPTSHILEISGISKAFGMDVEVFKDGTQLDLPYNDIYDLLPKGNENSFLKHTFTVKDDTSGESVTIALEYTSETNTLYRGYTNMIPNPGGGSHIRFFEDCYKEAWMKYLDNDFKIQDVLIGLRSLVAVFIVNDAMAFSGQTKERLSTNKSYFDKFRLGIIKEIQTYFDNNDDIRNGLIKRFKAYRAAQNKLLASKELSSLIYVNNESNGGSIRRKSVVDKLKECTSKTRQDTEFYITEGDSAAGSMVQARDVVHQAILPIRGKILNVSKKASLIECMKNEEIRSIVNSIGCGIGAECDASKSRYDRILIAADADPDGYNIAALLISIFVNLMPDLISKGMVYVVVPPLYGWQDKKTKEFHFTNELKDIPQGVEFTRYKGLGEMNADELYESCMDKVNQNLVQVEFPTNIDEFNRAMTSAEERYSMLCGLGIVKEISA